MSTQPDIKIILVLAANPSGSTTVQLDQEAHQVEERLRRSKYRHHFRVVHKWIENRQNLQDVFLQEDPVLVHFFGNRPALILNPHAHHHTMPSASDFTQGIVLKEGRSRGAKGQEPLLSDVFNLAGDGIEAVLLSGCYVEAQAHMLQQQVPYVFGTTQAIGEVAIHAFVDTFYDGLGAGKSIEQAFLLGRQSAQVQGLAGGEMPVLKKNPDLSRPNTMQVRPVPPSLDKRGAQKKGDVSDGTEKWQRIGIGMGIVTAILAMLSFVLDAPQRLQTTFTPSSVRLFGNVIDRSNQPIPGARIEVRQQEGDETLLGHATTDRNGTFSFMVKSKQRESVWVTVVRNDTTGFADYVALLGNKRFLFEAPDD